MRFFAGLCTLLLAAVVQAQSGDFPEQAIDAPKAPEFRIDPDAPDERPLRYYRLAPDTYFLFGTIAQLNATNRGWMGNAGFVVTPEGVVVIDALGTPKLGRRFLATIRSVTDQPVRYVIVTHNHPDHAYGAIAFKRAGARVVAHRGVIDYLASETMQASVDYRRDLLGEDMRGFEAVAPDIVIDEPRFGHRRLTLAGKHFDIYNAGRHHSHGDLVVHQHDRDIVWISDLAFSGRTTYMGDGHSQEVLEGIEWAQQRFTGARLMVPGHGAPQTPPFPMLQRTYDYVHALREKMRKAVDSGISLIDAPEHAAFPEWQDVPLYQENHGRNAHFVYREMEDAFFEEE